MSTCVHETFVDEDTVTAQLVTLADFMARSRATAKLQLQCKCCPCPCNSQCALLCWLPPPPQLLRCCCCFLIDVLVCCRRSRYLQLVSGMLALMHEEMHHPIMRLLNSFKPDKKKASDRSHC